jgi:2-polyprenyl-6-methoxyphenol hydroxylase-like FAD-dependent oxidoreductase
MVARNIRFLPFRRGTVRSRDGASGTWSLVRESDLKATLASVAGVLARGGLFGVDLVPDLPVWKRCRNKVRFADAPRSKSRITLVESVRQDRAKRHSTGNIEQAAANKSAVSLVFRRYRAQMTGRLENAGFRIKAVLGDYSGQPWDPRADVWLILAEKC